MKNGLMGFQMQTFEEVIDNENIIKQFGYKLPPKYEIFCKYFRLGIDMNSAMPRFLSKEVYIGESLKPFFASFLNYQKNEMSFLGFFDIKQAMKNHQRRLQDSRSMINIHELFEIGVCDGQAGICVGVGRYNIDKIYFVNHELDEIVELYEDIFLMANDFTTYFYKWFKKSNISSNQLYKNWDEDFWRIRQIEN